MKKSWFFLLFFFSTAYAQPIIIGTTTDNPPFNLLTGPTKTLTGFDIDIMNAICKRATLSCQFMPLPFKTLIPTLNAKKINLAIGAIMLSPKRKRIFATSIPYLESNAQFITQYHSSIKEAADIKHKRVGVQQGTLFGLLANKTYNHQIRLVEFDYLPALMNALKQHQVDVALIDSISANYWIHAIPNTYKRIGIKIPVGTGYGIIAAKNQAKLMDTINHTLLQLEADGTYLMIYNHYLNAAKPPKN